MHACVFVFVYVCVCVCVCMCVLHLFDLIDEGVYEMFDLWGLGWEQDQFLIGQIELQHVLRGDGYK